MHFCHSEFDFVIMCHIERKREINTVRCFQSETNLEKSVAAFLTASKSGLQIPHVFWVFLLYKLSKNLLRCNVNMPQSEFKLSV